MAKTQNSNQDQSKKKKCGIIMPIAANDDYPNDHWKEVLMILTEAISETEFEPRLVSDDVAIGLIHDRIVTNIYNDDIIVCDVSSKNPNVMFELGMRLAFDKPTIIIKDEKTGYSFDTGVIEHLNYPSSLRFNLIVEFKQELIKKINATYERAQSEPNFSPFLKSFGKTIVPASIQQTEIAESKFIISQLENLTNEMQILRLNQLNNSDRPKNLEIPHSMRKELYYNALSEFINRNKHLTIEDISSDSFHHILKREIEQSTGIRPLNLDIRSALDRYITNLEKK